MILIYLLFIFVLIIDVLFYIPLKFHFLLNDDLIGIYFFNIPIVQISKNKQKNLLKNKIKPIILNQVDTADIKYIEAIHIRKLYVNFAMDNIPFEFYPYIYPLCGLIMTFNGLTPHKFLLRSNPNIDYKFYCLIEIKLVKLIEEHILVRRIKNERASTK